MLQLEAALVKPGTPMADAKKAAEAVDKQRAAFLEEENATSDQNIVAAVTRMFYEDVVKEQHPLGFYRMIK